MNISKFLMFSLTVFSVALDVDGQQVYQAQAGAAPAQINQSPNVNLPQQYAIQSQVSTQQTPDTKDGISSLSGDGGTKEIKETNTFLEYYSRQGSEFSPLIYVQESSLSKQYINHEDLKKSVVVFFGDWCPHCDSFLKSFSKNVELLRLAGVKVIFINVPSIERLKNWKEPTVDEFNVAENKIASYGIKLSHRDVFVGLLGDRVTLAKSGVEGLPVVLAIKEGKEYFRGVGESGVNKLNLSDQAILKQFLQIWDKEKKVDNDKPKKSYLSSPKKQYGQKSDKFSSKSKKNRKNKQNFGKKKFVSIATYNKSHYGNLSVDMDAAFYETQILNGDVNKSGACPLSHKH